MPHLIIRHKVKDYVAWKAVFDDFRSTRKESGERAYQIFHHEDNPDNLILLFEWDTMDNAKTFMQSNELRVAMEKAGVLEAPEIHYTNRGDRGEV